MHLYLISLLSYGLGRLIMRQKQGFVQRSWTKVERLINIHSKTLIIRGPTEVGLTIPSKSLLFYSGFYCLIYKILLEVKLDIIYTKLLGIKIRTALYEINVGLIKWYFVDVVQILLSESLITWLIDRYIVQWKCR